MHKKNNILLPIAGKAIRFLEKGFNMPKPLIMAKEKNIIDWALESINYESSNLIFACRSEHIREFAIDEILSSKFGKDIKIVSIDGDTDGSVSTCLLAEEFIDNDLPLLIYTPDVFFQNQFNPDNIDKSLDGFLLTFKANNPSHSYVKVDDKGFVIKTAEKEVISTDAAVGLYYFKSGKIFIKYAKSLINKRIKTKNEYYICPMYNLLVQDGLKIKIQQVEKMHVLGTPQELDFFINKVAIKFGEKAIGLCSDHSGFKSKELAKLILNKLRIKFIDFGCYVNKDTDYNEYVKQATDGIKNKIIDNCLGFCRTGQGINILANKQNGIRSALIYDEYTAEMAVRHNCVNFFSIPERNLDEINLENIINSILKNSFDGGRHTNRVFYEMDEL